MFVQTTINKMRGQGGFWAKLTGQDKINPERYYFIEVQRTFDKDNTLVFTELTLEFGGRQTVFFPDGTVYSQWATEVNYNPDVPLFTKPELVQPGLGITEPAAVYTPTIVWMTPGENGDYRFFYGSEIIREFRVTSDLIPQQYITASGENAVNHPYIKGVFINDLLPNRGSFEDPKYTRIYPVHTFGNNQPNDVPISYFIKEGILWGGGTTWGEPSVGWAKWDSNYVANDPTGNITGCWVVVNSNASTITRAQLTGNLPQGQSGGFPIQIPTYNGWIDVGYDVFVYNNSEKTLNSGNYYTIYYDRTNNLWLPINNDTASINFFKHSGCPENDIEVSYNKKVGFSEIGIGSGLSIYENENTGTLSLNIQTKITGDNPVLYSHVGLSFGSGFQLTGGSDASCLDYVNVNYTGDYINGNNCHVGITGNLPKTLVHWRPGGVTGAADCSTTYQVDIPGTCSILFDDAGHMLGWTADPGPVFYSPWGYTP
jgi:hypothetical protein